MGMRVKMGTDDQRVLGLGRTAEDNRRRGLAGLPGTRGDVRWYLRPEEVGGPWWKVNFSRGLCNLGSLGLQGQDRRQIKYKVRPISRKVLLKWLGETAGYSCRHPSYNGSVCTVYGLWGMLPHRAVEKRKGNFEGQRQEKFYPLSTSI